MRIHVIAAIGRNGQIGLNGRLPWSRNNDDLKFFRRTTMGHIVVLGNRTMQAMLEDGIHLDGRHVVCYNRSFSSPDRFISSLHSVVQRTGSSEIWIAGGAYVYTCMRPFVTGNVVINFVDYNGPADTYFPLRTYGININQQG